MLAVPPALLQALQLQAGSAVGLAVNDGRLVIEPTRASRPRYTLDQLLAAGADGTTDAPVDRLWVDGPPVGAELV